MAKVRVIEAATEGFRLVGREPKSVFVWSAVMFVALGVPSLLLMQAVGPAMAGMIQAASSQDVEGMFAAQGRLYALMTPIWLLSMAVYLAIGAAVLRAVITPEDRARFYLRLGSGEGWMLLSALVAGVLAYIASFIVMIVVMLGVTIPMALMMSGGGQGGIGVTVAVAIVVGAAAQIVLLYVMLRFSMGPILGSDQKQFRLFESWPLTKGQGWRLVGLMLLMILAIVVVELIIGGVILAAVAPSLMSITASGDNSQIVAAMVGFYTSPWMWLIVVLGSVVSGPLMTLMIAPWARAYLMLRSVGATDTGETAAEVF